jgi:hypothetical protein
MNELITDMLKKVAPFLALLYLCTGCYVSKTITSTIPTLPTRQFKIPPQKIVVGNAYDITKADVRNNKEQLFGELINLTVRHASNEINRRSEIPASFVEGLTVRNDSSINALMTEQLASHAIIIKSFNAYFEQTDVVVTETESGKNREAFYDIIVDIRYAFHSWSGHQFDTLISVRKFHSSRTVLSGLLAAGPNVVKNSADAADGIYANVDLYLKSFFSGSEQRSRNIYISKDFKAMDNAIKVSDYEKAFEESEKHMTSDKKTIAAMAAYNCAVLLEHLGQYSRVKYYLEESMARQPMPETEVMLLDYRIFKAIH